MNGKYICSKCNFEIPLTKKKSHDEYCKDLPSIEQLNNYIPCEFCNESIEIHKYNRHIEACSAVDRFYHYLKNPYLLVGLNLQNIENSNEENDNNNEMIQISTGVSNSPINLNLSLILRRLYPDSDNNLISDMIEIIKKEMTYDEYQENLNLGEQIGKVEIGVNDIDTVSKIINRDNFDNNKCPVCQELLNNIDLVRETKCQHLFCNDCITQWLSKNKSCPICNIELE